MERERERARRVVGKVMEGQMKTSESKKFEKKLGKKSCCTKKKWFLKRAVGFQDLLIQDISSLDPSKVLLQVERERERTEIERQERRRES